MADMMEYLKWRGDIRFSQLPPNPVDALIFSTLSYIRYDHLLPDHPRGWIPLSTAAQAFLDQPDAHLRVRVHEDLELLRAAAESERFGQIGLSYYRDVFIPEEDTQFCAVTYYLDDGSAFLAFRGTDHTLVGWKEDFNMSFQESVPAQRLALEYVRAFAGLSTVPMRLGGHSKGGNLAVYAAAKSAPEIQERILEVYNQDGPGFTGNLMGDAGYQAMVPKIRTYVPQSSIIGMLLEHEEPYTIIRSKQISFMQHDPYSWEVLGKDFVPMEEITADSRFLNQTIKTWLAGMDVAQRNAFFDTVFDLLAAGDATNPSQIMLPKNIRAYAKLLGSDENMRHILATQLDSLIHSMKDTQHRWDSN